MENVDQRIINYAKTCKNGELTTTGFKESIGQMSLSAKAGQVALKGLAAVGKTIGNMAVSAGIMLALNAIITGITDFVNREKEAIESAKEAAKVYEEKSQKLSELKKQYEDILDSTDQN